MRQICDHFDLIHSSDMWELLAEKFGPPPQEINTRADMSTSSLKVTLDSTPSETEECPVCLNSDDGGFIHLPCTHKLCSECTDAFLSRKSSDLDAELRCPLCRAPFYEGDILEQLHNDAENSSVNLKRKANPLLWSTAVSKPSTKTTELLKDIRDILQTSNDIKVIIFRYSVWIMQSMVFNAKYRPAWVRACLHSKFKARWITLSTPQVSHIIYPRKKVLDSFKSDPHVRILIASLRSVGVGLNLTIASRVIMLDPWWNQSVENQ